MGPGQVFFRSKGGTWLIHILPFQLENLSLLDPRISTFHREYSSGSVDCPVCSYGWIRSQCSVLERRVPLPFRLSHRGL
jgi:hypothetical protein